MDENAPSGRSLKPADAGEALGNGEGSGDAPGEHGSGARGGPRNVANVVIVAADCGKYTTDSTGACRGPRGTSTSSRNRELRADSRPARYALERSVSSPIFGGMGSGGTPASLLSEVLYTVAMSRRWAMSPEEMDDVGEHGVRRDGADDFRGRLGGNTELVGDIIGDSISSEEGTRLLGRVPRLLRV